MTIALKKEVRDEIIQSIQRYFEVEMDEKIGNLAAGGVLEFVLAEIGPVIYNKAVADVQERLQIRVSEVEFEVHEEEFQYWQKRDQLRRR